MKLSPEDADLFFKLIWGLQFYVNQQRRILPDINSVDEYAALSMTEKEEVRDALWEFPDLIDAYVEKNPDAWPAFDSNGAFAGLIPTSGQPTNCTLVGNVLYVTAFGGGVYSIRLNVTGVDRNPTSIQQVTWGGVKANGLYGTAETVSGSADRNR